MWVNLMVNLLYNFKYYMNHMFKPGQNVSLFRDTFKFVILIWLNCATLHML